MIGYKVLTQDLKSIPRNYQFLLNKRYWYNDESIEIGRRGFHFIRTLPDAICYARVIKFKYWTILQQSLDIRIYEVDTLDGNIITSDKVYGASSVIYLNREITKEEIDKAIEPFDEAMTIVKVPCYHPYSEPTKEDPKVIIGESNIKYKNEAIITFKAGPKYKECLDKIDVTVVKDRLKIMQEYV